MTARILLSDGTARIDYHVNNGLSLDLRYPRESAPEHSAERPEPPGAGRRVRWFLPINRGLATTTLDSMTVLGEAFEDQTLLDQAQLGAAGYLNRHSADAGC